MHTNITHMHTHTYTYNIHILTHTLYISLLYTQNIYIYKMYTCLLNILNILITYTNSIILRDKQPFRWIFYSQLWDVLYNRAIIGDNFTLHRFLY